MELWKISEILMRCWKQNEFLMKKNLSMCHLHCLVSENLPVVEWGRRGEGGGGEKLLHS